MLPGDDQSLAAPCPSYFRLTAGKIGIVRFIDKYSAPKRTKPKKQNNFPAIFRRPAFEVRTAFFCPQYHPCGKKQKCIAFNEIKMYIKPW